MIALKIIEIKTFMEKLFKSTMFDDFEISSADISTLTDFKITGTLNKNYYSSDELEVLGDKQLVRWVDIKDLVFYMIKGHKSPLSLKIVFSLPCEKIDQFIQQHQIDIKSDQINGLFFNIRYDQQGLSCTSGTSLKLFTMDKSLDQLWDASLQKFMKKHEIIFE
jgi:hypothetical protein